MPALLEKLWMDIPIIQAPMAGVSTPELAAAVSNAGALGSIGVGAMSVEAAWREIEQTQAMTARAFNVNLFCHQAKILDPILETAWMTELTPHFQRWGTSPPEHLHEIYTSFNDNPEMLSLLLEKRPAVVSFHFGLPSPQWIAQLQQAGILLMASATKLDEARAIERAGLDAIIAQGIEAGGHRGVFNPDEDDEGLSTTALTRLLISQVNLPVIAAGGLMDGTDIRHTLSLGAEAAQLGTAFIPCPESAADPAYRAALLQPSDRYTILTQTISGRPARGLNNALTDLGKKQADAPFIPPYPFAYDAAKALHALAKAKGCQDYAAHWAGQGFRQSRVMPAADLIRQLNSELSGNPSTNQT